MHNKTSDDGSFRIRNNKKNILMKDKESAVSVQLVFCNFFLSVCLFFSSYFRFLFLLFFFFQESRIVSIHQMNTSEWSILKLWPDCLCLHTILFEDFLPLPILWSINTLNSLKMTVQLRDGRDKNHRHERRQHSPDFGSEWIECYNSHKTDVHSFDSDDVC